MDSYLISWISFCDYFCDYFFSCRFITCMLVSPSTIPFPSLPYTQLVHVLSENLMKQVSAHKECAIYICIYFVSILLSLEGANLSCLLLDLRLTQKTIIAPNIKSGQRIWGQNSHILGPLHPLGVTEGVPVLLQLLLNI